jgi:hypothetical protein
MLKTYLRGVKDTADACGDPLTQTCTPGAFNERIFYATPTCAVPQPGYQEFTIAADCSATPGDITDLQGSPVVGAFQVSPAPLGIGGFCVGAYCGA